MFQQNYIPDIHVVHVDIYHSNHDELLSKAMDGKGVGVPPYYQKRIWQLKMPYFFVSIVVLLHRRLEFST